MINGFEEKREEWKEQCTPLIAAVNAVDNALALRGGHITNSFLEPEMILQELQKAALPTPL
jgi:hypothetical protein